MDLWVDAFLLIAVLPGIGQVRKGSQSWLSLGFMDIQPAEFAKIMLIVAFAQFLSDRNGKLNTFKDFLPAFAYVGVPMLLIMRQPDLGTSLVFIGIFFGMMFVAGANPRLLLGIFAAGLAFLIGGLWVHFNLVEWLPLKKYQLMRLVVFLDPYNDGRRPELRYERSNPR